MVKLSVPMIKALANAASVSYAELRPIDHRPNTVAALVTRGLITKTIDGYQVTTDGLIALRAVMPDAVVADCHLTLNDILSETPDEDSTRMLPEHLTSGLNHSRVKGEFSNSYKTFFFRGKVTGQYLSAKIHGFRIPMLSVLTDDNESIFVLLGSVKPDNWRPTTIKGNDPSDPVLDVLGTEIDSNGETVLWVASEHGEFTISQNYLERYCTAFPVQPEFTRWIVTRMSVSHNASDFDRAMSSQESNVLGSRDEAYVVLQRMLRADIHQWADMGMDYAREEALFTATMDHPDRNTWQHEGIRWTIRGW